MATKRKRIQIVTMTETVKVCQTKKIKVPIWKVFADEQQVRFNKQENKFEFRWDTDKEWEDMEWENWLGDDGTCSKGGITETLTHLLALIKATK